jgi:uncharacterized repeat protein (TIGR01451 family)
VISDADNLDLTDAVPADSDRRLDRRGRLRLQRQRRPVGRLQPRSSGSLGSQVDHRPLPRRHDDGHDRRRQPIARTATSDEDSATGSDTVAIVEDVQLSITKAFDPTTVTAGTGGHTIAIDVKNNGVSDADGLAITDTIDPRLLVDSIVGSAGVTCASGQDVDCSIDHLAAGTTATVTVTYHVAANAAAASVDNTASTSSDEITTPVDSATQTLTIETHADVADVKIADLDVVIAGNDLTYTITVKNSGPSDALSVVITDVLDLALTNEKSARTTRMSTPTARWPGRGPEP